MKTIFQLTPGQTDRIHSNTFYAGIRKNTRVAIHRNVAKKIQQLIWGPWTLLNQKTDNDKYRQKKNKLHCPKGSKLFNLTDFYLVYIKVVFCSLHHRLNERGGAVV